MDTHHGKQNNQNKHKSKKALGKIMIKQTSKLLGLF